MQTFAADADDTPSAPSANTAIPAANTKPKTCLDLDIKTSTLSSPHTPGIDIAEPRRASTKRCATTSTPHSSRDKTERPQGATAIPYWRHHRQRQLPDKPVQLLNPTAPPPTNRPHAQIVQKWKIDASRRKQHIRATSGEPKATPPRPGDDSVVADRARRQHDLPDGLRVASTPRHRDLEVIQHVVVSLPRGAEPPRLARGQRIQRQLHVTGELLRGSPAPGLIVDQLVLRVPPARSAVAFPTSLSRSTRPRRWCGPSRNANERSKHTGCESSSLKRSWRAAPPCVVRQPS